MPGIETGKADKRAHVPLGTPAGELQHTRINAREYARDTPANRPWTARKIQIFSRINGKLTMHAGKQDTITRYASKIQLHAQASAYH